MLEYRGLFPSPCSVVGCHMAVSFLDTTESMRSRAENARLVRVALGDVPHEMRAFLKWDMLL